MKRLHQKCLVGSIALHAFLLALLVFAPAFLTSRAPEPEFTILTFIPDRLVDEEFSNLGAGPQPAAVPATPPPTPPPEPTPAPTTPPPTPPPQAPPRAASPPPQPAPDPAPPRREPDRSALAEKKPAAKKPVEPAEPPPPKRPEVKVNLNLVKRSATDAAAQREQAEATARAEAQRQAQRAAEKYQNRVRSSLETISKSAPSRSDILAALTVRTGGGAEGALYASYKHVVYTVYLNAWQAPSEIDDESAACEAQVAIARAGNVIAAKTYITRRSGIPALDKSVQAALDRVRFVAPFPESARDAERVFTIVFNLKAKRSAG